MTRALRKEFFFCPFILATHFLFDILPASFPGAFIFRFHVLLEGGCLWFLHFAWPLLFYSFG